MWPLCCVLHRPRAGAGQDLHNATVQPERRDCAVSGTWCVRESSRSGRMPSGVAFSRSPPWARSLRRRGQGQGMPARPERESRRRAGSESRSRRQRVPKPPAASPEAAPAASRGTPITTRDTSAHPGQGNARPSPAARRSSVRTTATAAPAPPRPPTEMGRRTRGAGGLRRAGAAWARGSRCNTPPPNKAGESSLKLIEAARKITTSDANLWFDGAGLGRRPRW
jgi:hypothetical protein